MIVLQLVVAVGGIRIRTGDADIVVGRPPTTVQVALPGPTVVLESTTVPPRPPDPAPVPMGSRAEIGARAGLRAPDAQQYGAAVPFESDEPVRDGLLFVLVIGSDARRGEPLDRSRADSIHLLAVNPTSGTGTVLGLPRDTWTEIPRRGKGKINTALALGGPDLLSETVQHLTGLPVHYWVLTGFDGLVAMVDALGRLTVPVERRMADRSSGAYFDRGFHSMSGREVLAFSRDRHSVARGDFSRSENQGTVILQALRKLRVEVGDPAGIRAWVDLLFRHARLETGVDDAVRLGATARRLDPDRLANIVAPGRVGTAGRQSVVYLSEDAAELFEDLRPDATVGEPATSSASSTSSSSTSTTSTWSSSTSTTSPSTSSTTSPSTTSSTSSTSTSSTSTSSTSTTTTPTGPDS